MDWQVTSRDDPNRWVAYDRGAESPLSGDRGSLDMLAHEVDGMTMVALTPLGPFRDVETLDDELGVFLMAMQAVIPGPHDIIGSPPVGVPAEVPEGAVS